MTSNRFALQVQELATAGDRVLVIGDLVGRHNGSGRFLPAEVRDACYGMDVPPPANVPQVLARLKKQGAVLQHPDKRWALTPSGRRSVEALALEPTSSVGQDAPAAEFAHVSHTVIPAWAAPPRWAAGIARLLERHPFESNVLCMTRFPTEGDLADPVVAAIEVSRRVLARYGLTLHLASDAIVDDDLFGNVGAYMWACQFGLGIVEDRVSRGVNYNAMIEIGGMVVTGRRCAVLKDETVPSLPTDLAGHIYRSVSLDNEDDVERAIATWARSDLGFVDLSS